MPTIEARNRNTVTKKQRIPFKNQNDNKINRAQYGVGDVEVFSDLFLRERLECLHVPHRLDVVPPEVGFVLRQSQRLQPRVGVRLSKKKPAQINTSTCWGPAVIKKRQN